MISMQDQDVPNPFLDSASSPADPSAWWTMAVGHAVVDREASTCAKAYADLKNAIDEYAKAQEALDTLPQSQKPASGDERNREILSWAGTNEDVAKSKINEYALRDAARQKVEIAREKMAQCRDEAERTYQVVVKTLAK
jgi:hypothetical protein